jgi:hypothetical protein
MTQKFIFISHKNEVIDVCFDDIFNRTERNVVHIIVMIIIPSNLWSLSIVCKN